MPLSARASSLAAVFFLQACASGGFSHVSNEVAYSRADVSTGRVNPGAPVTEAADREESAQETRLVIYTADLRISVVNHAIAMEQAMAIAKETGGFIESSETLASRFESRVTMRVPAARFQETIAQLAKIGTVTERNVSASDVTREFLDTENRIQLSKLSRDRLYTLLKRVTDLKERVKILREIDRLTREIDSLSSRTAYLKSRADFSTITVSFFSGSDRVAIKRPSPFRWVREITAKSRTIFTAHGRHPAAPAGFFDHFAEFYPSWFGFVSGKGECAYQAAEGTCLRGGSLENAPEGTLKFWQGVLTRELERRGYKILESREFAGGWLIRTSTTENLNRAYYTIYLRTTPSWIHVAEAFYPTEETLAQEKEILRAWEGGMGE